MPAGSSIGCPIFCVPGCSQSPAATQMATISTDCAATRRSSSPAGGCPTPEPICARSPPSRAGRTRPRCATHPPDEGHGRSLLRQLPRPASGGDARPPPSRGQAIDDTVDVVHGHQQLSFFNAHYDERCFLPIHVYDTATARPVAVLLRPGKTPSGKEVRGHLRRLVRRIRKHWPQTHITIRGDGHYSRPQVMAWCEENGVGFASGCPATSSSTAWSTKSPTTSAPAVRSNKNPPYAASPRPAIRPSPGIRSAVSVPALRPPPRASTFASSPPAFTPA